MQSPLIPAPTMTQSKTDWPSSEATSLFGGVIVDTEHRNLLLHLLLLLFLDKGRRDGLICVVDKYRGFTNVDDDEEVEGKTTRWELDVGNR